MYSSSQNKRKSWYTKILIEVYLLTYMEFKFVLDEMR